MVESTFISCALFVCSLVGLRQIVFLGMLGFVGIDWVERGKVLGNLGEGKSVTKIYLYFFVLDPENI